MSDLNERALLMMQVLAGAYAQGETPWGPDRGLATRETAADAVLDVFATLDALRTDSALPPNRIEHTIAMLMLIREYIVPSPLLRATRINCGKISSSSSRASAKLVATPACRARNEEAPRGPQRAPSCPG